MALQCPASTSCNPTDNSTLTTPDLEVLTFINFIQFCTPCVPSDMAPEPEPEGFGCCCNDCAPGELVEPASKGRDSAEALEQATDPIGPIPSQTTYLEHVNPATTRHPERMNIVGISSTTHSTPSGAAHHLCKQCKQCKWTLTVHPFPPLHHTICICVQ
jgi:hypothetical protein